MDNSDHDMPLLISGVDEAGECNMTTVSFRTDVTRPSIGRIRAGPFYDMVMNFVLQGVSIIIVGYQCTYFRISLERDKNKWGK